MKYAKLGLLLLAGTLTLAGCAKKQVAVAPPTPPPAPQPTADITASPSVVTTGQPTTITWKTSNANDITISGIGTVSASGSRELTPAESTTFTLLAKGPGGSADANARVTVNQPPKVVERPAISEEELFRQNVHDVFFAYDKFNVEGENQEHVSATAKFLQSHPDMKLKIEGYCDERGSVEYNLALGDNRANAVKTELVKQGIGADRITTISYGKEKPFCTDSNEECWAQNRRGHIVRQ